MAVLKVLFVALFAGQVLAQTNSATASPTATASLTNCHNHGNVQFCDGPDGDEIARTTFAEGASETGTAEEDHDHDHEGEDGEHSSATGCHTHGSEGLFCTVGDAEWQVTEGVDDPANAPEEFNDCHSHGENELHCTASDGTDATLQRATDSEADHDEESTASASATPNEAVDCHFHAGVEHCVDADGNTVENSCAAPTRDYNIPLRIGLVFVILVTSAIGVFLPIFLSKFPRVKFDGIIFVGLRQFGTGIIISTALVHLFTHAQLYFGSDCLTGMQYEATAAALVMAGLFVTFLIEFFVHHIAHRKGIPHEHNKELSPSVESSQDVTVTPGSVSVMEAGIVFHSILIGITLVVAGDTSFITLFVVILFHQMFEGIALGTRLAMMAPEKKITTRKMLMAGLFAIITPIGMAIGIGVLSSFNGNDPSTIIAIGTLNAFSAGILLWIGLVEMWADEWWRGPLANGAGWLKVTVGMISLVAGMALMSLLGRWA